MKTAKVLAVALTILVLDQVSKTVALSKGLVTLNRGVSMSIGAELGNSVGYAQFLLVFFAFALWSCIIFLLRKDWISQPITLGAFSGAVFSNVLDRLVWGGVQDWIKVSVFPWKNNLADYIIVASLVWIGVYSTLLTKSMDKSV